MGYALITGGGPDGRYTVQLDYGEARRLALVAALQSKLVRVDKSIVDCQVLVTEGDARVAVQAAKLETFVNDLVSSMASLPPGSPFPSADGYTVLLRDLRMMQAAYVSNRIALEAFKLIRIETVNSLARFQQTQIEVREAWCADFTEDASGQVATLEIPGEPARILIAARGRGWIGVVDGQLRARELMSPEQVYFNAAILPGWQIDRPTYRWGTLTAIDWDGNTGTVTLGAAFSSAQRLEVNRKASMAAVPFEYMTSNARAFDNDSRVVLDLRQGWDAPRIIGFLDNPRPDPPKFGAVPIPTLTFVQGVATSHALSSYWTGGANPRGYVVHQGSLPAGVALNSTTGAMSGTTSGTGSATGIVVRCSDTFYAQGKNQRYDDSNAFIVQLFGGWAFYDRNFSAVFSDVYESAGDVNAYAKFEVGAAGSDRTIIAKVAQTGTAFPLPVDTQVWFQNYTASGAPSVAAMYVKLSPSTDVGGHYGASHPIGSWQLIGGSGYFDVTFSTDLAPPGDGILLINYALTIEIATDSSGVNVVSTITADGKLEYHPT